MNKKVRSTTEEFIESLSPARKKKFYEGYKDFALSEIVLALMEEDEISVRELAKIADVSPTVVQAMRTGKKDFSLRSFFKVLNGLGCNFFIEHKGQRIFINSKKVTQNYK